MAKIGVQMMMLKEIVLEQGVFKVLKKLHELGFSCVEVSQIPMTEENVKEMKTACSEFQMEIAALSAAIEPQTPGAESLSTDFDKIVADCKFLNCNYLRVGMMPLSYMGSLEKSLLFANKCEEMAKRLSEHGIHLYYHNHHIEFVKYNGKYLLDLIRDNTTKLGFEIDVYWVQYGGENPVEYIKQYKGKLELLHLKDYRLVEPDFTGVDMSKHPEFLKAFTNVVRYAEIGSGNLDFPSIIQAGLDTGVKYLLIEQDDCYGKDPFHCLEVSRANLVNMGYEGLF
ncbi:MAG: sugar phosphate isomerase/epimerase [Eubacteriales bacterium]